MEKLAIRKVAVLGAGVMGAQIAAHCMNAGIPVVLFDLASPEGDASAIARKAIERLQQLKPAPLGDVYLANFIQAANYNDDLPLLQECDLIIEAIAERLEWKYDLYKKVTPHIAPHSIFASNTSGLPITLLAQGFADDLKKRFCGVHFFNPPRYMPLVELIPTQFTQPGLLDHLETFLVSVLGKGVVRAFDTPNFIGNRVGIFSILATMIEAEKFGIPFDVVDDLTGVNLGRAKSATFRTSDVVGLDTLVNIIHTMQKSLEHDSFHPQFQIPSALAFLLEKGWLGQKTGAGFFKKVGKEFHLFDATQKDYVLSVGKADPEVIAILKQKDPAVRLQQLHASKHPQAQFVWAILRDMFHYIAVHLEEIAPSAREVDFAMRWGYGQVVGPFELWQSAGWKQVADWVQADIQAGRALSPETLPDWVFANDIVRQGVHTPQGSWSARDKKFVATSDLAVYQKHLFSAPLVGNGVPHPLKSGVTVSENSAMRLWTVSEGSSKDILIASFKNKGHFVSAEALEMLQKAITIAEKQYSGLVLWNPSEPFSQGMDVPEMVQAFQQGGKEAVLQKQAQVHALLLQLYTATVPTVAALNGAALGVGFALSQACQHRVLHFESSMGYPQPSQGLLPLAGGLVFTMRRAIAQAQMHPSIDRTVFITAALQRLLSGHVAVSAIQALQCGYICPADQVVMNTYETLAAAFETVRYAQKVSGKTHIPLHVPTLSAEEAQRIQQGVSQGLSLQAGDGRLDMLEQILMVLQKERSAQKSIFVFETRVWNHWLQSSGAQVFNQLGQS